MLTLIRLGWEGGVRGPGDGCWERERVQCFRQEHLQVNAWKKETGVRESSFLKVKTERTTISADHKRKTHKGSK